MVQSRGSTGAGGPLYGVGVQVPIEPFSFRPPAPEPGVPRTILPSPFRPAAAPAPSIPEPRTSSSTGRWGHRVLSEDAREALAELTEHRGERRTSDRLRELVDVARAGQATWWEIGAALGITDQGARTRFRPKPSVKSAKDGGEPSPAQPSPAQPSPAQPRSGRRTRRPACSGTGTSSRRSFG